MADEKDVDMFASLWKKSQKPAKKEEEFQSLWKKPSKTQKQSVPEPSIRGKRGRLSLERVEPPPLEKKVVKSTKTFDDVVEESKPSRTTVDKSVMLDESLLEELEDENHDLSEENRRLKIELAKNVELFEQMERQVQNLKSHNRRFKKQKRSLVSLKNELQEENQEFTDEIEEIAAHNRKIAEEREFLRERVDDLQDKIVDLEEEISDLTEEKRKMKGKLEKYSELVKSEEEGKISFMQAELELKRLEEENSDLKFQVGQLEQKLKLKKLGMLEEEEEELIQAMDYDEKLLSEIMAQESKIKKLEEELELKEIQHKAKLNVYQRALQGKEGSGEILEKEELKEELRMKEDHLKEKEMVIKDLESQLNQDLDEETTPASGPVKTSRVSGLAKRVVTLEKLLENKNEDLKHQNLMVEDLSGQLEETVNKVAQLESELMSRPKASKEEGVDTHLLNEIMQNVSKLNLPESSLEKKVKEYGEKLTQFARENERLKAQLTDAYRKITQLDLVKPLNNSRDPAKNG